jgi:hypothetical protein
VTPRTTAWVVRLIRAFVQSDFFIRTRARRPFDDDAAIIDPDVLTVAEHGREDVDSIVKACGQAAAQ